MVCDNDVFIDFGDSVNIIEHPIKDGLLTNLQQWLREILREFPEPRGIAGGNNDILHDSAVKLFVPFSKVPESLTECNLRCETEITL